MRRSVRCRGIPARTISRSPPRRRTRGCSRKPTKKRRRSTTSTSRSSTCCSRWLTTPARSASSSASPGLTRDKLLTALRKVRGNQRVTSQNPEATYQSLEQYGRDLTKAAEQGQARSGHRARRRDPARHPGALAPHQEQSGPHRRARRRQDRDRRRTRAAHRARRRPRRAEEQEASSRSTWAR